MLPKALFLSTIEKIRQQEARIDEFDKALSKMCDGFPAFDKDNLYLLALRDLLKYTMQDQYGQYRLVVIRSAGCRLHRILGRSRQGSLC